MTDSRLKVGDHVAWRWLNGLAEGVVVDIIPDRAALETKGKTIVRNGTTGNPAVIIRHTSGTQVLKLSSEIQRTQD